MLPHEGLQFGSCDIAKNSIVWRSFDPLTNEMPGIDWMIFYRIRNRLPRPRVLRGAIAVVANISINEEVPPYWESSQRRFKPAAVDLNRDWRRERRVFGLIERHVP
jgi:hypothetical protein